MTRIALLAVFLVAACPSEPTSTAPGHGAPSRSTHGLRSAAPSGKDEGPPAPSSSPAASGPAPSPPVASAPPVVAAAELRTWRFDDTPAGRIDVVVSIPATAAPVPVLIALHGQGEAFKGPARGARGWLDDYGLDDALDRLAAPPLTRADLQGIAPRARVEALNGALAEEPYRGLVVVMPYTPDILADEARSLDAGAPFGRFVVDTLLPRVAAETPADLAHVGIDGVSLGGRMALLVGLAHADRFACVAAMQPAIYPHELDELTRRASAARATQPSLALRLLTSEADFYRGTVAALASRWRDAGIDHRHDLVAGPHAYAFNRGPGVYEMLLFHDRTLRGRAAP